MIIPSQFSLLFTLIAIAFLVGLTYSGYKDGFITKALELLSTVVSIVLSWVIADHLKTTIFLFPKDYNLLSDTPIGSVIYQSVNRMLLFIVIFILLRIIVFLLKPLFKSFNWVPLVGGINRILGSIFGFVQGVLFVFILTFLLSTPLFANGEVILQKSGLVVVKDMYRSLMFMFDDTFDSIESIQKVITPANELKDDDYTNITTWLEKQGFDALEQQEIIEMIKHRNGQ